MPPRYLLTLPLLLLTFPALAQLTAPVKNDDTTITVTGTRESTVEMSDWRMAETPHVVVFSQNDEEDLRFAAHNLEKLHFLLSALFGRVDAPDETIKVAVTMIGHVGAFEQLRLTDLRWQYGPFPWQFSKTTYYDPREEGPVLATTKEGVKVVLRPSLGRPTNRNCYGAGSDPLFSFSGEGGLETAGVNELAICHSAESRLYSAFAQNYLMTYFPAAYPRWFLQGFGEIFATLKAGEDFVEYGHLPPGFLRVMEHYQYSGYPITDILDGRYLSGRRAWTPYHAWRLVHFLYFSDEWKPRLHQYLGAIARGADLKSAASALGDPAQLQSAVNAYKGRKVQFERMTFPAERAREPVIRRMTRAEAGLIRGRLELGARIELPATEGRERSAALERRSTWLERLRENARQFPNLIEHHLLLAEAECRTGNPEACLAAAERAISLSPRDATALVWKGTALAQLAVRAPAAERQRRLNEARSFIARAIRLDTDGILPLIAFYNSFAVAGSRAPDNAVEALAKVVQSSPAAPSSRLKLGEEFLERDLEDAARETLLPVAMGPFDTPEQPAAAALLPPPRATKPGS